MEQWPVLASHVSPLNLMTDFQFLNFLAIFYKSMIWNILNHTPFKFNSKMNQLGQEKRPLKRNVKLIIQCSSPPPFLNPIIDFKFSHFSNYLTRAWYEIFQSMQAFHKIWNKSRIHRWKVRLKETSSTDFEATWSNIVQCR